MVGDLSGLHGSLIRIIALQGQSAWTHFYPKSSQLFFFAQGKVNMSQWIDCSWLEDVRLLSLVEGHARICFAFLNKFPDIKTDMREVQTLSRAYKDADSVTKLIVKQNIITAQCASFI